MMLSRWILVLSLLAGCTTPGPELGPIQRLNSEAGNLGRFIIPYYTGLAAVSGGGAVAIWMEQTGGYRLFFLSRAPDAATMFGAPQPLAPAGFADTVASGLSVVGKSGTDQVAVTWQTRKPLSGDKFVFFRGTSDGGRTWTDVRQLNGMLTSFGASLAADRAGGLFAAWPDERATAREVFFNRSLDHGATWLANEVELVSSEEQSALEGVPRVASDGDQRVLVVWSAQEARRRVIKAALSEDRGATFAPSVTVDDGRGRASAMLPQAAFAGSRALVVWITGGAGAEVFSQVWADTSIDGKTWGTDVLVRDLPGGEAPNVRITSDDTRAHLVFDVSTRGGDLETVYHLAVDGDGAWIPPVDQATTISSPDAKASSPHVAHDAKGTLYVAYVEDSQRVQLRRSRDGGANWDPPVLIHARDESAPEANVKFPQVAAADGVAYVLWEEWGDVREVVKSLGDVQKKRGAVDLYVRRVTFRD